MALARMRSQDMERRPITVPGGTPATTGGTRALHRNSAAALIPGSGEVVGSEGSGGGSARIRRDVADEWLLGRSGDADEAEAVVVAAAAVLAAAGEAGGFAA